MRRPGRLGARQAAIAAPDCGRLDLAVVFCAPAAVPAGLELELVRDEPAVVHLPAGHPLATRTSLSLADLAGETVLIAGGGESGGFTDRVLRAFDASGLTPRTAPDPYPDLGLRAVSAEPADQTKLPRL